MGVVARCFSLKNREAAFGVGEVVQKACNRFTVPALKQFSEKGIFVVIPPICNRFNYWLFTWC